jgi:chemotaxis family two-component system response regulator Rcp1
MAQLEILLVEDSPTDQLFAREALAAASLPHRLHVVDDGVEALLFLRQSGVYADRPRPDIVLLDLNLPRKDGREVLAEVKADAHLSTIPVIVLTTSGSDEDVTRAYGLRANCYVSKPVDFEQFKRVIQAIQLFWFEVARLPPRADAPSTA